MFLMFFVFVGFLLACSSAECPAIPPPVSHLCDLQCFLPNASFALPPFSLGFLALSGGVCNRITLANVSSAVERPGARLALGVAGFGVTCIIQIALFGVPSGDAEIEVGASSLQGTVVLQREGNAQLPDSVVLEGASADLNVVRMEAAGFEVTPSVLQIVKQLGDQLAVSFLRNIAAVNGTALVKLLAEMAALPLPPFGPVPAPAPVGSVNLSASVVAGLGFVVGKLQDVFARAGQVLEGAVLERPLPPLPFAAGGACGWLEVMRVRVATFEQLQLELWPEGELGLAGNASLLRFNATVEATLVLSPAAGPDIVLALSVSVAARRPAMQSKAWAELSAAVLRDTRFLSELSAACLLHNASMRGVHLLFEEGLVTVALDGPASNLQTEVIELFDNLNLFFVQTYGPAMPFLLAQAVAAGSERLSLAFNASCRTELVADPYDYDALFPANAPALGAALGAALCTWLLLAALAVWMRHQGGTRALLAVAAGFFLAGCVACYAAAAASNQAWVWLSLRGEDTFVSSPTLALLSFSSLVSDSWNAGAYINAVGLVVLGLVVPVVRALLLLGLLVSALIGRPPLRRAGMALEALGKLGAFVLTEGAAAKVAFTLAIAFPAMQVHVYLYPAAGFYLFLGGNLSGLIGGELALAYLRSGLPFDGGPAAAKWGSGLGWSRGLWWAAAGTVAAGAALTVAGLALPSLRFVMGGAVAEIVVLANGADPNLVRELSVLQLVAALPQNVLDDWGLQGVYIGTFFMALLGVAIPLTAPLVLGAVLVARGRSRLLLALLEGSRALNGTENWLLVMVASFLSIELLGTFIVGPACRPIDALLSRFPQVLPEAGGRCLSMTAEPAMGFYLLLCGAVLISCATYAIVAATACLAYGEETVVTRKLQAWGWMHRPTASYELLSERE